MVSAEAVDGELLVCALAALVLEAAAASREAVAAAAVAAALPAEYPAIATCMSCRAAARCLRMLASAVLPTEGVQLSAVPWNRPTDLSLLTRANEPCTIFEAGGSNTGGVVA
jgi:hypothetical protein